MDPELKLAIPGTLTTITSKGIELRSGFSVLVSGLCDEFAQSHFLSVTLFQIAITQSIFELGPPDFVWK